MKKILKFNTKDQNIWFTSDSHFGHLLPAVWSKRGFSSVEEHDRILIERWNSVVRPEDMVIFLGDFSLNSSVDKTKEIFNRLNGHIFLLWGNHDSYTSKIYKEELLNQFGRIDIEVYPVTWNNKVTFVGEELNLIVDKKMICCSHFPKRVWDKMGHGAISLSGHSHSSDKESNPDYPYHKRLDVGIENFGRPISFKEVMDIMNKKQFVQLDHHNSGTN